MLKLKSLLNRMLNWISAPTGPNMTTEELNTWLNSLNRDFRGTVDWIVEEGTSGIWTYRKWDSGVAECWGTASGTTTCNAAFGSSLQITPTLSTAFTSDFFVSTPCVNITSKSAGNSSLIVFNTGTTTKDVVVFQLGRPTAIASVPYAVDIQAKGRWK